jgi:hypothetical protein
MCDKRNESPQVMNVVVRLHMKKLGESVETEMQ